MGESSRAAEYAELVQASCAALAVDGAQSVARALGVPELLTHGTGAPEEELALLAFLEAQGYHLGTTPTLAAYGLWDLLRSGDVPADSVLAEPSPAGPALCAGWTPGRPVVADHPGRGLLLFEHVQPWADPEVDPASDDYLVALHLEIGRCTSVLGESATDRIRPAVRSRLMLGAATETLGACHRMLDDAVGYVQTREQFGQPLAAFAPVREMLAWAATEHHQLQALVDEARGVPAGTDERLALTTIAKALAGRVSRRVVQLTLQVTGGIGFTWEYPHHGLHRRTLALDAVGPTSASLIGELGRSVREIGEMPDFVRL